MKSTNIILANKFKIILTAYILIALIYFYNLKFNLSCEKTLKIGKNPYLIKLNDESYFLN